MKISRLLTVVAVLACFAFSSTAKANSIDVTGNMQKDGRLLINVNWNVDTAKYPSLSRDAVRQKVHDEIWHQMLPKVKAATKDVAVSYNKSNFTLVNEDSKLIERRQDGSKLYTLKMLVEFDGPLVATKKPKRKMDINHDELKQRWDNEL